MGNGGEPMGAVGGHRLSTPTIAKVDGVAVGAGLNLALGCDLVVASDRARFSEIFSKRGLSVPSRGLSGCPPGGAPRDRPSVTRSTFAGARPSMWSSSSTTHVTEPASRW
jgi:hypothetical protein